MTTVFIVRNKHDTSDVYHTDADCPRLKDGDLREPTRQRAEAEGYELCDECADAYSRSHTGPELAPKLRRAGQ